jgi:hypothetical protein
VVKPAQSLGFNVVGKLLHFSNILARDGKVSFNAIFVILNGCVSASPVAQDVTPSLFCLQTFDKYVTPSRSVSPATKFIKAY